jgi:hypothetical protein
MRMEKGYLVPHPSLPERSEKGEVLSDLRRCGPCLTSQGPARYDFLPLAQEFIESSEIAREAPYGRLGNLSFWSGHGCARQEAASKATEGAPREGRDTVHVI